MQNVIEKCTEIANQIRIDVIKMTYATGNAGAHIGGGLSMVEIMAVLYGEVMKLNPDQPQWEERDRFILSKGHGSLTMYAAMKHRGFINDSMLETYKKNETELYGHPSMNTSLGIEFSSGSLGQGLSLGVGTCLALRRKENTSSRVFVLMGDGECNEGSVWEAALAASHYRLDRLVAIIDKNGLQYDGTTNCVLNMEPFVNKWEAFGFQTIEVDGHNVEALYSAMQTYPKHGKPLAIIANTVKGKGISYMENNPKYHNARLSQKDYENAMVELGV